MFAHLDDRTPPAPDAALLNAARHEGRRRLRRRRAIGGAFAAAAVTAVVTAGALQLPATDGDGETVVADAGEDTQRTVLSVPVEAGVAADELVDGTPVWLVHHDDGSVTVLDAASAHRSMGASHLVDWCATGEVFVDQGSMSVYDQHGTALAGPAAEGLKAVSATPAGGSVAVERSDFTSRPQQPTGASVSEVCPEGSEDDASERFVQHSAGDREAMSVEDAAADADPGDMVAVRDAVIVVRQDGAVACPRSDLRFDAAGPQCGGVTVAGLAPEPGDAFAVLEGTFLARFRGGVAEDVRFIEGMTTTTPN